MIQYYCLQWVHTAIDICVHTISREHQRFLYFIWYWADQQAAVNGRLILGSVNHHKKRNSIQWLDSSLSHCLGSNTFQMLNPVYFDSSNQRFSLWYNMVKVLWCVYTAKTSIMFQSVNSCMAAASQPSSFSEIAAHDVRLVAPLTLRTSVLIATVDATTAAYVQTVAIASEARSSYQTLPRWWESQSNSGQCRKDQNSHGNPCQTNRTYPPPELPNMPRRGGCRPGEAEISVSKLCSWGTGKLPAVPPTLEAFLPSSRSNEVISRLRLKGAEGGVWDGGVRLVMGSSKGGGVSVCRSSRVSREAVRSALICNSGVEGDGHWREHLVLKSVDSVGQLARRSRAE